MSGFEESFEDSGETFSKEDHRKKKRYNKQLEKRYKADKNIVHLRKTVYPAKNSDKKTIAKLKSPHIDNYNCNVLYSMNKKNRFQEVKTQDLLATIPDGVNVEVRERNIITEKYCNNLMTTVHTRKLLPDSLDVDVQTTTTLSIRGQPYSNFLPENRTPRKTARTISKKTSVPSVAYDIYKTNGYANNMEKRYARSKSRERRRNKKIDADEEYYQYHRTIDDSVDIFYNPDEDGEPHQSEFLLNPGELMVKERLAKKRRSEISECSSQFEVISLSETCLPIPNDKYQLFSKMLSISNLLKTEGHTFQRFDAVFDRIQSDEFNFEKEIDRLKLDNRFDVKDLRPKQYLVDATKYFNAWNPDKIEVMETTVVIVFSFIKKNRVNVLINSTISENLSRQDIKFWKGVISSAESLWDAVQTITSELAESSGIIERMKLSSSFYGFKSTSEMLNCPEEWKNQLEKTVLPNRYDHDSWTIASEVLNVGTRVEWSELTEMLRSDTNPVTKYPIDMDVCDICQETLPGHLLFYIAKESMRIECASCLKAKFYKEYSAARIPIDLKIDTSCEIEYLPAIVPLTVLNSYFRTLSNQIYKSIKPNSIIEKCPQCRTFIHFKNAENNCLSCPCGYCWCKNCSATPHWPMTCEGNKEWKTKCALRYNLKYAQGTGSDFLMQITCHCKSAIFHVRTPKCIFTKSTKSECPSCKLIFDTITLTSKNFHIERNWRPNLRNLVERKVDLKTFVAKTVHPPYAVKTIQINKIPNIKTNVINICETGRVIRFDLETRNHFIKGERQLIREQILEKEVLENLRVSTAYLAEFVTGWMYETNYTDKVLSQKLEFLMANRHLLMECLEDENKEQILKKIQKLKKCKDDVIEMVTALTLHGQTPIQFDNDN